ncbi:hypothetical protein Tco_0392800 [Tanacetum coccineum]
MIERYTRGFLKEFQGNITSLKPATLHDAINMAHELVEQTVQGKATRIGDNNKRKWEDHQRNTNNNNHNNHNNNNNRNRNNNYNQQQNWRQETARAYAAASTENRGYVGNLPKCNHCTTFTDSWVIPSKEMRHDNGVVTKVNLKNKCLRAGTSILMEHVRELTWWFERILAESDVSRCLITCSKVDLLPTRLEVLMSLFDKDWFHNHRVCAKSLGYKKIVPYSLFRMASSLKSKREAEKESGSLAVSS